MAEPDATEGSRGVGSCRTPYGIPEPSRNSQLQQAAVSPLLGFLGLLARRGYFRRLKRDNFPVAVLFYPNPSVANVAAEWLSVDRRLYGI